MSRILKIENLHVNVDGKEILKGINMEIKTGEFHAIMGPNGSGKSTLAGTIMGHYKYEVTKGKILLDDKNVLEMSVDERSRNGLFLAMQYPNEVNGITNSEFIKTAMQARLPEGKHVSLYKFITELESSVKDLKMNSDLPHRYLNEGFSGGERKRNEILQLKMLKPSFAILDEIDSGLDVDALKIVGENVSSLKSSNFGGLIITHYERLLDYIKCDYVHVIVDGKIIKTGGQELIEKIDSEGYDWVKTELGIFEDEKKRKARVVLGTCAVKDAITKEAKGK